MAGAGPVSSRRLRTLGRLVDLHGCLRQRSSSARRAGASLTRRRFQVGLDAELPRVPCAIVHLPLLISDPRDGCAMALGPMLKRFGCLAQFGGFCRTGSDPHVLAVCAGSEERARQDSNL